MILPQFPSAEQPEARRGTERTVSWPEQPEVLLARIAARAETVLLGKRDVITEALAAMLAGGHVLLEDVPGVGKTVLARAFARLLGGQFQRIQFTPDLLPADVVGGSVWDVRRGEFLFRPGPVMANIVLADELNRASPRTQSALLEVMEERRVTVDGETRKLPEPFILIATQNPLDCEGTYPLPEAQLDRFMMRLSVGYPDENEEVRMLEGMAEGTLPQPEQLRPVVLPEEWLRMRSEAARVHVQGELLAYAVRVAAATRRAPELALGASPRASRDWLRASQARAYMEGRGFVLPDDLLATAQPVLLHRLAARGVYGVPQAGGSEAALSRILSEVPLPSSAGRKAGRR
ncbi:AAA family ATPase [Paenibacillus beijingensis]|uniref:ATPase n=1 Tax=Paenibacillus beijingensis TaxID=1126833 RepID=A0A0D5NGU3_9BACL|nr:MoxR family ATPase [Paenibacillus beijingensis]AJY74360.1 ATPase [Paenibacillus beijingensis]